MLGLECKYSTLGSEVRLSAKHHFTARVTSMVLMCMQLGCLEVDKAPYSQIWLGCIFWYISEICESICGSDIQEGPE